MEMGFAVMFVFFLHAGVPSKAQGCCVTDDQFQTQFALTVVNIPDSYDPSLERQRAFGNAAYDFFNRQYAWNLTAYQDKHQGSSIDERIIMLFNKNKEYMIYDGDCYVQPIYQGEPQQCIPDSFQYLGSSFAGDGDLLVDSWNLTNYQGGKVYSVLELVTTYWECIPVVFSYFRRDKTYVQGSFELDGAFSDYVQGVDQSMFDIPKICHNATMKSPDGVRNQRPFRIWQRLMNGMM